MSDGLLGDLGHILTRSQVGASVDREAVRALLAAGSAVDAARQLDFALSGGDDYELCFAAPPNALAAVRAAGAATGTPVTRIGRIDAQPGLRLLDAQGQALPVPHASFDHFA